LHLVVIARSAATRQSPTPRKRLTQKVDAQKCTGHLWLSQKIGAVPSLVHINQWIELRRRIHNEHAALRQLERETRIHRKTLRKIRDNSEPPGNCRTKPAPGSRSSPAAGARSACFANQLLCSSSIYFGFLNQAEVVLSGLRDCTVTISHP
jgi:hypothetical protein